VVKNCRGKGFSRINKNNLPHGFSLICAEAKRMIDIYLNSAKAFSFIANLSTS
jgi:hypothetical protein